MFRYFVSFAFGTPTGLGFASLDITTAKRISSVEELHPIREQLTRRGYTNISILAFSLYAAQRATNGTN